MENPGDRFVGDYLRHIKGCDFIDFNVYTKQIQGEIDVIGINHATNEVFVCEVVTHLTNGIQYVKAARPDTADRLIRKFRKDIEYGRDAFKAYAVHYMLWSPVVRASNGKPEYDQFAHVRQVQDEIRHESGIAIPLVCNEDYVRAIDELRVHARLETKELKSPVMRFLQIEEWARKNVERLQRHRRTAKAA